MRSFDEYRARLLENFVILERAERHNKIARELDLLIALARRDGGTVNKAELLAEVWGFDFDGDDNIVEVYVRYLRNKIDKPFDRASLQTIRTLGYRLVDDALVPR